MRGSPVSSASPELASYTLQGDSFGGHMIGEPITPVILTPGDYAVCELSDRWDRWYFVTEQFTTGTGVSLLNAPTAAFGATIAYEIVETLKINTITVASNLLNLSWSKSHSNAVMQVNTNLISTNDWTDLPIVPVITDTGCSVSLEMTNSWQFYRLRE